MNRRHCESIIVLAAGALLAWGLSRAAGRGAGAMHSWTTYAMVALTLLTAINIVFRARAIALVMTIVCGLFILVVLAAACLASSDGSPFATAAVARSIGFFVLLGVGCMSQMRKLPTSDETGQQMHAEATSKSAPSAASEASDA